MFIEVCPKCGGELERRVVCCYPPVHVVHCNKCGFHDEQRDEIIHQVYKPPKVNSDINISYTPVIVKHESSKETVENKDSDENKVITGADLIKYIVDNKAYDLPIYRMGEPCHGEEYVVGKVFVTKAEWTNEDILMID